MAMMSRRRLAFVLTAALLGTACGGGSGGPSSPDPGPTSVSDFITGVASAAGDAAVLLTSALPAASGGPTSTVSGANSIPAGGSSTLQISASGPFDSIHLSVADTASASRMFQLFETLVAASSQGYWQLKLPAAATSATIAYVVNSRAPVADNGQFSLGIQVVSPTGSVGPSTVRTLTKLLVANDLWSVGLGTVGNGLDVSACGVSVPGGFTSQVLDVNANGVFRDVWSPRTPVVEVSGTLSATQLSATFACVGTAGTGSMSATGSGSRLNGTATLSGRTIPVCLARGTTPC